MGAGAVRVEARHLAEVVGGAGQLAELEEDGGQAVVDVRHVGLVAQRLEVEELGLVPLTLGDGLLRLQAQRFDQGGGHSSVPSSGAKRGRPAVGESRALYRRPAARHNGETCGAVWGRGAARRAFAVPKAGADDNACFQKFTPRFRTADLARAVG